MAVNSLRIASYNIRKARGLDQKRRPERTLQVINALEADVVVLQEADRRMGERLPAIPRHMIETETDFQLIEVSANEISLGWHGNAILVRKGVKVTDKQRLVLPGFEPRGAVRIDLDIAGGTSVVAVHLGLLRRDRRAQLEVLAQATEGCRRTIIAGDFNEWSTQKGLEPLDAGFDVHTPGCTFHARRPMAALDRFAMSTGVQLVDAGVAQSALAQRASDHLPIWSDVAIIPVPAIC
jgi:endonuclease/exonuclease/phosphatase family metal-dependent hydrolase